MVERHKRAIKNETALGSISIRGNEILNILIATASGNVATVNASRIRQSGDGRASIRTECLNTRSQHKTRHPKDKIIIKNILQYYMCVLQSAQRNDSERAGRRSKSEGPRQPRWTDTVEPKVGGEVLHIKFN